MHIRIYVASTVVCVIVFGVCRGARFANLLSCAVVRPLLAPPARRLIFILLTTAFKQARTSAYVKQKEGPWRGQLLPQQKES